MKKVILGGVIAALAALPIVASAQSGEGKFMVRGRVLSMKNDNGNSPPVGIEASDKVFPEFDFTYFITRNLATELVLTYPQKHDISLNGANIGTVKQLPPTLMLQWHFIPEGTVRPYVGIGLNYTMFSDVKLTVAGADIDRNSWGLAYGAGVDIRLARQWFLNLDAKYVNIETDVKVNGSKLTTLEINPWLLSVGVGYRF